MYCTIQIDDAYVADAVAICINLAPLAVCRWPYTLLITCMYGTHSFGYEKFTVIYNLFGCACDCGCALCIIKSLVCRLERSAVKAAEAAAERPMVSRHSL